MDTVKQVIADALADLLSQGVRKANIEIELIHFIKRELAKESE
jgi:hypothetical protein